MGFEWDEAKSEACYTQRGFDFNYALRLFLDPERVVRKDHRWDYGEDRFRLNGAIEQRVFVLIYTGALIRCASSRLVKPIAESLKIMKTKRIKIDLSKPASLPMGRMNTQLMDATTDEDIFLQVQADEQGAVLDAAKFARRVRRQLGLTQLEFSQRIDVSLDTIRNWEQGKRCPTGAAKALLKVLEKHQRPLCWR